MCRELEKIYTEGIAEGRRKTMLSNIKNLIETIGLSVESAMTALKIPENERQIYTDLLEKGKK